MTDQNSQFFAILTAIGKAKQANADALGIPWTFAQMGVGDANDTDPIPNEQQTHLINERRRAPLNQLKVDSANPNIIIAEQVIPENVGGWWIREVGLYDADGDLVAVANCAPSFKPLLTQGSGRTQVVRMNLIISNTANVELKIDPSVVLATRAYVDGLTVRANQVEAETGTDNSKIMTPLRVFQAIGKVIKQATESAFGWAKIATQAQVTTGTDDTAIVTPKKLRAAQATQVEAEAGTDNTKTMTPLRVFQAIAKVVGQATETVFGWAKVATQSQVTIGTDDTCLITPKKLRAAQATQAEAEAGTDNTKIMTPLRVFQAIANVVTQSTESAFGWAKIASQSQVNLGTDDATIVSPKKLRWGFSISLTSNGYIVFPTWLGGLIIQWANGAIPAGAGIVHVNLALAFPNTLTAYSVSTSQTGTMMSAQSATPNGIDLLARTVSGGAISTPPGVIGYTFICLGS